MKRRLFVTAAAVGLLAGCGLSSREREMVGDYFISEISDIEPLYELHGDGTSVMRAIRPEVLTCWVEGRWHIDGDSLILENDLSTVKYEGDRSLMGEVATRSAYHITDFNGTSLTLRKDGIDYVYHRRLSREAD